MSAGCAASRCGAGFWGGVLAASLLLSTCPGCKERAPAAGKPTPAPVSQPALRAEDYAFAGCAVVRSGPRCELGEARELTFWVPTERPLQAATDAGPLLFASTESTGDGQRYQVRVPAGVRFVDLREPGATSGFRLPVSDAQPVPLLMQATALRAQGKFAQARALLQAGASELPPEIRARAGALLARIALSEDDYAAAAVGLHASMDAALAASRISDAIYDATALAYLLVANLHDYVQARAVLERALQVAAQDPAGAALIPHYQALLSLETGDVRTALLLFRQAATRTSRLGLRDHALIARQKEATTLVLLGRHAEAIATQQRILADFPISDACQRADAQERLVWFVIQAEPAPSSAMATVATQAAAAAARELAACPSPRKQRNHLINAGLFALEQEDTRAADTALASLEKLQGGNDALLVTWEFELRGRSALRAHGSRAALAMFQRALVLSQRAGLWDNEHLAEVGIGQSFEQLRKPQDAVKAYAAAEGLMDCLIGSIPLGEGQAGFLHEREVGTQRLVALLVALGKPATALDVARHARARVIQAVARPARFARMDPAARAQWEAAIARYRVQRAELERAQAQAWQLPADRLKASQAAFAAQRQAALEALDQTQALSLGSAPNSERAFAALPGDEALLAFFPLGAGVIGIAARANVTVARLLPAIDLRQSPAVLGAALLEPFRAQLAGASALRVITHAELLGLDVHALELDAAPLITRVALSYPLDAPTRSDDATAAARAAPALIVANPTADLPAAEREGQAVRQALAAAPNVVLARGDATRVRVLAALPNAALFHYAGHGQFAGTEGIDSGLRLADGELSLGDILALPAAPRLVVLSACEGARADGPGFAGGLSVAEAFIAAGVQAVVASTRPVADDTARALVAAFYAARAEHADGDAAGALRSAQLQLRKERPDADWASFRLLTR